MVGIVTFVLDILELARHQEDLHSDALAPQPLLGQCPKLVVDRSEKLGYGPAALIEDLRCVPPMAV